MPARATVLPLPKISHANPTRGAKLFLSDAKIRLYWSGTFPHLQLPPGVKAPPEANGIDSYCPIVALHGLPYGSSTPPFSETNPLLMGSKLKSAPVLSFGGAKYS